MIVPFVESEEAFNHAFQQSGFGMPRYRGSPMIGGSFWGRIVGFAKGLFSKAAPHISNLITKAQPHVKNIASQALSQAVDSAVNHVVEKLSGTQQQGSGRRKRIKKIIGKGRKRCRIKKAVLKGSKL